MKPLLACILFFSPFLLYGQLSFYADTVYFKGETIHKVSVAPDGPVWCLRGLTNTGIGLIGSDGAQHDMTGYLSTITSASFSSIQGFENGLAFIGTHGDYLYKLSSDGNHMKLDTVSGIAEKNINSVLYTKFDNSIGLDVRFQDSTGKSYLYKPKIMVVATDAHIYITDDFNNFHKLDYDYDHFGKVNYDAHYAEKDFLTCTFYANVSPYQRLNVSYKNTDETNRLIRADVDLSFYDSLDYHRPFEKINTALLNSFRVYRYLNWSLDITSFLYWGTKDGLKKRAFNPNPTSGIADPVAILLNNQEVFTVKIAPFRTQVKDTSFFLPSINDTIRYTKDVVINRYIFAGSDSGFYYGKALYNLQYRTVKDTLHKVLPVNASFTKVYDIGVDSSNCGFLWLATDNGLYKIRTNFQKDLIHDAILPQGTINLCNRNIPLKATLNPLTAVQWQKDGVDLPGATSLGFTSSVPGMYRYRVTNGIAGNCYSKPTALVKDTAITFSFPNRSVDRICPGDTARLTVHGRNDYRYQWYQNGLSANQTDTILKSTANGLFKVKVTNCYDQSMFSDSSLVSISTITGPQLTAMKNPVCAGDSTPVFITATGYLTKWQQNGDSLHNLDNTTQMYGHPYHSYLVSIKDSIGCFALSNVFTLNGIAVPSVALVPNGTTTLCLGSSIPLAAVSSSTHLLWSTGESTTHITVSVAGVYFVKTWFDSSCPVMDSVKVTGVNPPAFRLKADTSFCFGELVPIQLSAPQGYVVYSWNGVASASNTFSTDNEGTVSLTITDANNCTTPSAMVIYDNCKALMIPSVFTPNGDGVNEAFEIKNLLPHSTLSVYNRWGTVIYNSDGYDNSWKADGAPEGLYYYNLFNSYYKNSLKGWVEVVR